MTALVVGVLAALTIGYYLPTEPIDLRRQHRCPRCGCHVTSDHVPASIECDDARVERQHSRGDA